jgi:hypothetical protein
MSKIKDARARSTLQRLNLQGYNKPKRTPDHPTKSHVVMAKEGEVARRHGEGRRPDQAHPLR